MRKSLLLTSFATCLITAPVQARDFAPRDECRKLDGASAFRAQLANAVTARDKASLLALTDKDVKLDFGGGHGHTELASRLDNSDYSLWNELDKLLVLGCAGDNPDEMIIPWYFAQDLGQIDPFEGHLITGTRVALRDAPSLQSNVLRRLSWVPVIVDYQETEPGEFWPVKTIDGRAGFVHRNYLRSFVDYRMIARKGDDGWKMTVLIAGD